MIFPEIKFTAPKTLVRSFCPSRGRSLLLHSVAFWIHKGESDRERTHLLTAFCRARGCISKAAVAALQSVRQTSKVKERSLSQVNETDRNRKHLSSCLAPSTSRTDEFVIGLWGPRTGPVSHGNKFISQVRSPGREHSKSLSLSLSLVQK